MWMHVPGPGTSDVRRLNGRLPSCTNRFFDISNIWHSGLVFFHRVGTIIGSEFLHDRFVGIAKRFVGIAKICRHADKSFGVSVQGGADIFRPSHLVLFDSTQSAV